MSQKCVAIVEAGSNGYKLPFEFHDLNMKVIHVQTRADRKSVQLFRPFPSDEAFDAVVTFEGDMNSFVEEIKQHNPIAFIPGCDLGVKMADELNHRLGLERQNIYELSRSRRDKYEMQEQLKKAGLDHTRQIVSTDLEEVLTWSKQQGWPVFVKPKLGVASIGNRICLDEEDLRQAYDRLQGELSPLVEKGEAVEILAQELIDGDQYCINFTSWQGRHYLFDLWKYIREPVDDGGYVFHQYRMVPCVDRNKEAEMIDYCHKLLDATGFKYGPSHLELIYVPGRGPVLVEINPRVRGSFIEKDLHVGALGNTQPSITALAYSDTDKFLGLRHTEHFDPPKYLIQGLLHFHGDGFAGDVKGIELLETLPSFARIAYKGYEKGAPVKRTEDESYIVGCAYLYSDDLDQIRKDADQLLEWQKAEKVGFEVDPA